MFRWVPYTMVRIAAFFIVGILVGIYQPEIVSISNALLTFSILVILYVGVWLTGKKGRFISGIIGLTAIGVAGFCHVLQFTQWNKPGHLSKFEGPIFHYRATVTKLPEEKEKSFKYEVKINSVFDGANWNEVSGKALVYIRKDQSERKYFYGDNILIRGAPDLLKGPTNPNEFDFRRFLGFRNIYHQDFVKPGDVVKLGSAAKDLRFYSYKVRAWATAVIKERIPEARDNAIALALTLGVTDGIDNDLRNAYSSSGAMHVLAVSGLHVGILYGIVILLLRPIKSLSWARWVNAIVTLLVLWSFAFITGLSPSVLRAVTMFSFIALAKPFGRSTSIYNTLAGSTFILLIYDPYLIMSVGFQLSYLAVLGIISIHRPLYQLIEPSNRLVDWVWNISCVSIAAQLSTFSLGLLYFHQFPVYFLVSNLFVIPGAFVVLVTSLLLLASNSIPFLSDVFAFVLQWSIKILNYGVFTFESLPYSLLENVYINTTQCWLLMGVIAFLVLLSYRRSFYYLLGAFSCAFMFSLLQWSHFQIAARQDQFLVYNIPGHRAIEWISKGTSRFVCDSVLSNDAERIRFHIRPTRLVSEVRFIDVTVVDKSKRPLQVYFKNGKTIGVLSGPIGSSPTGLKLDYLVVGNNAFRKLEEITDVVQFDQLILDSTYSPYIAYQLNSEDNDRVHSVLHEGAFLKIF
ncbi:MAG: ComEC family competence protein [Cyclobacteriaceae bacterium]|nr:ComEC family competence protein [Cyclobacteriaceae bacterium]